MAFYQKFEAMCKVKGVTPTQAGRDNGVSQGVVSMWKKRGSTPKAETVQKLADYFGCTVDYLIGAPSAVITGNRRIDRNLKIKLDHFEERDGLTYAVFREDETGLTADEITEFLEASKRLSEKGYSLKTVTKLMETTFDALKEIAVDHQRREDTTLQSVPTNPTPPPPESTENGE